MKVLVEWEPNKGVRMNRMQLASDLLALKLKKKHPGKIDFLNIRAHNPRHVDLDLLVVNKKHRKQGVGSDVVQHVVKFTKRHKAKTTLYPVEKNKLWGTTSGKRLVKFYTRHGFKPVSKGIPTMVQETWEPDYDTRFRRMTHAGNLLARKLRNKHSAIDKIAVSGTPSRVELSLLVVGKGHRKQGIGSDVVQNVVKFAKRHKLPTVLTPASRADGIGTTSKDRLVKFYKRHGFKVVKSGQGSFRAGTMVHENTRDSLKPGQQ